MTGAAVLGEVASALTALNSTVIRAKLATVARILVWVFTAYLFYLYIQVSALELLKNDYFLVTVDLKRASRIAKKPLSRQTCLTVKPLSQFTTNLITEEVGLPN
ncbi:unannotated protein [freshwater metagenome]|uniref:Unannotated protein n=1 Tax=freshwater metagenome TaxID=449393 RepID=A0A6J6NN52_9ZZZZ